jgi:hypothetical protein
MNCRPSRARMIFDRACVVAYECEQRGIPHVISETVPVTMLEATMMLSATADAETRLAKLSEQANKQ